MRFLSRFAARERIELIGSAPQEKCARGPRRYGEPRVRVGKALAGFAARPYLSKSGGFLVSPFISHFPMRQPLRPRRCFLPPQEGVINGLQGSSAHFSYWPVYLVCTRRMEFDAAKCPAGG